MGMRKVQESRKTKETDISLALNLDGTGNSNLSANLPFLEHMLDQTTRYSSIDLDLDAKGDLEIDAHHTVEDIGITLGAAFDKALGDKKGIHRFGYAYIPLDEALSRVVIDFSGRPGLVYNVSYPRARVGEFDVELLSEFFHGFSNHAKATIHIDNIRGKNAHHIAETIFKAFGKAIKMAISFDENNIDKIPSTKEFL
jgi:imidazoleglycerol-phosphate dehydratase